MVQFDPSLESLADLRPGWYAWRVPDEPWQQAEGEPTSPRRRPTQAAPPATNIEIKARRSARLRGVESMADTKPRSWIRKTSSSPPPALKLRIFDEHAGELIHYHRADAAEPKASRYRIAPTSDPLALKAILEQVLPVAGSVRKRRSVYHVGQTRIHLDQVERLGDFLELEVVLRPDQPEGEGTAIALDLLRRLGISGEQLVPTAYIDLLRELP